MDLPLYIIDNKEGNNGMKTRIANLRILSIISQGTNENLYYSQDPSLKILITALQKSHIFLAVFFLKSSER